MIPKKERWKKPFGYAYIQSVPDDIKGVYGFWNRITGRCLYIGKSGPAPKRSIKIRLMEHWHNCHNPALKEWITGASDLIEICYLEVKGDTIRIKRVEDRLIRYWHPETND